ncbi:probable mixed-linked glucan synthase 7 [Oryza brachyantha]|uniref:probable mixed-linked glucan synthase 7 n=1 Tax=Oryza brachyantha TaxID=4533 RepID=UPI001ADA64E1|nr:probable mixed-linked glucan synthase 7 [Oryza brachyantha]
MPPSAGLQATESLPAAKKDAFVATGDEASPEAETKLAAGGERPLVLTTRISTTTIRLYRFVIFVRIGIFVLFFMWRITYAARLISSTTDGGNMRKKAAAFRTLSIAGELWFAFMWVLDQLPKTMPVRRAVDVAALADESLLPKMDVFVTTADPDKEPPLATANTVLSILAADYPAGKMTCYVSDDGGAELTHEAVVEAARFAVLWVPFCRKHSVEPRSPEVYFNAGEAGATKGRVVARGSYKGRAWPELVRDRRRVRREYEEMRIRIDALQARRRSPASGTRLWRRHGTGDDHAGAVQVLIDSAGRGAQLGVVEGSKLIDLTSVDGHLPALVYVRREKRRGRAHHRKAGAMNALLRASAVLSNAPFILNLDCDHYVNNSEALRASVCFMIERGGAAAGHGAGAVAFVQFPQRFDGVDPADRYANHNRVFFDCTELGLDGLQGPIYVGTGCLFRRVALYGVDPPRWRTLGGVAVDAADRTKFGDSAPFLASVQVALHSEPEQSHVDDEDAIAAARALVSCSYEDRTAWGEDVGWVYGTVTEDVATGFVMHRRGWRSAYFAAAPDAFRGTAPINLADRLQQVLRWAAGSLEIFFSRNNVLLAGGRLHPLQRVAYLNTTVYPFTSLFLMAYCLLPAVPLIAGCTPDAVEDMPPTATYVAFLAALMLTLAAVAVLETRWSGIPLWEWWRNEQFWMVSATGAYLAAVAQVALKVAAGKEISFKLTTKSSPLAGTGAGAGKDDPYAELYAVRWTVLMVPTSAVLAVNVASMAAAWADTGGRRWWDWDSTAAVAALRVAFNAWVVVHLYPFALGLMGRRSKALRPILFLLGVVAYLAVRFLYLVLQFHSD